MRVKKVFPRVRRGADPSGTTYYPSAGSWRVLGAVEVLITGTAPAQAGAGSGAPSVNRTYYTFGGARVAMRDGVGAGLVYLHGDHPSASLRAGLGSTSLTTNASGQKVSEQPFDPFGKLRVQLRAGCYKPGACPFASLRASSERQRGGELRWSSGTGMPTDPSTDRITGPLRAGFTFTSQRASSYGTIFMSAREYLPSLGRFLSADSIVPGAGNPQALNRYAYVFNSPLRYVDPSGHDPFDPDWAKRFLDATGRDPQWFDYSLYLFSLSYPDEYRWDLGDDSLKSAAGTEQYVRDRFTRPPAQRSWGSLEEAVTRLATYYKDNEQENFTHDLALVFGGFLSRFEAPWVNAAFSRNVHQQVHIVGTGGRSDLIDGNGDANIHHWAAYVFLGYFFGQGPAKAMNRIWESTARNQPNNVGFSPQDIALGDIGAAMGASMQDLIIEYYSFPGTSPGAFATRISVMLAVNIDEVSR